MLLTLQQRVAGSTNRAVPGWAVAVPLLITAALFMFVDARVPPIYLWDESRLAVNALEMSRSGWSLVTTYGSVPDLWNTKPPLLIWLMTGSIRLFGPSELALRVPSMVAALGTLIVVFAFVRRVTHSLASAALAIFLLSASVAFFGEHGARTADFDALLCFFTTSYLALLFFAVHQKVPSKGLVIAAGALIAGAAMTKTIAGLVPGAGVALYLLLTRRIDRPFRSPAYVLMLLGSLVPLALFYLARENAAPGYLHAVWYNDFAGRYQDQLGPMRRNPWFFFQELGYDWMFSAGPLALLAPLGLLGRKDQSRQALLFALCCVITQLTIISLPATRLIQYMLPAVPWLAIACAIAFADRLPRYFANRSQGRRAINPATILIGVAILFSCMTAVRLRYELLPKRSFYPEASYGFLFETLHQQGVRQVTIADPGLDVSGLKAYAPQLDFYTSLWSAQGLRIARATDLRSLGGAVASCNPALTDKLIASGGAWVGTDGCALRLPSARR